MSHQVFKPIRTSYFGGKRARVPVHTDA